MSRFETAAACLASFVLGCLLIGVIQGVSDTVPDALENAQHSLADAQSRISEMQEETDRIAVERDRALAALAESDDAAALSGARKQVEELKAAEGEREKHVAALESRLEYRRRIIEELRAKVDALQPSNEPVSSGFVFTQVKVNGDGLAIGEVTNRTGTNYNGALFDLSVYDGKSLVETVPFSVNNLPHGATRSFRAYLDGPVSGSHTYKIDFDTGF